MWLFRVLLDTIMVSFLFCGMSLWEYFAAYFDVSYSAAFTFVVEEDKDPSFVCYC